MPIARRPQAHACAVPACGKSIPTSMLMCGRHWSQVPEQQQIQVHDAFRKWRQGTGSLAELRAVQQAAVETVRG